MTILRDLAIASFGILLLSACTLVWEIWTKVLTLLRGLKHEFQRHSKFFDKNWVLVHAGTRKGWIRVEEYRKIAGEADDLNEAPGGPSR